jgi:hypothetical protein
MPSSQPTIICQSSGRVVLSLFAELDWCLADGRVASLEGLARTDRGDNE